MKGSYPAGRALLWFMIAYHVLVGALLIGSGDLAIRFAHAAMGWTIEGGPALGIAGELLGCYLIAFALMLFVISLDPQKYRPLIDVAIVLIVLRVAQRIIFSDKVMEVFQVPEARYWSACVFVALLGVGLLFFRRQIARSAHVPA